MQWGYCIVAQLAAALVYPSTVCRLLFLDEKGRGIRDLFELIFRGVEQAVCFFVDHAWITKYLE